MPVIDGRATIKWWVMIIKIQRGGCHTLYPVCFPLALAFCSIYTTADLSTSLVLSLGSRTIRDALHLHVFLHPFILWLLAISSTRPRVWLWTVLNAQHKIPGCLHPVFTRDRNCTLHYHNTMFLCAQLEIHLKECCKKCSSHAPLVPEIHTVFPFHTDVNI